MASGGDGSGPSRYGSGKGPMENLLEHVGEALTYDDVAFHQFLEERVGSQHPSPNPPITIPEFGSGHNTPYSNDPHPLRMIFLQVKVKVKKVKVKMKSLGSPISSECI